MPLDAVCLTALLDELRPKIVGARVDKVQQPQRDKILLALRGKEQKGKLLLAAGTGSARLHLTEQSPENPQSPPMFCMLLRKHLTGARLVAIEQPPMERIARLVFDTYNELGEPGRKALILELVGKNCNLILVDGDEIILDALRRVDEDMSRTRRIQPGLRYHLPETQGKQNPLDATLVDVQPGELLRTFEGLSPLICRELADRTPQQILDFFAKIRMEEWAPYLLADETGPVDFSYTPVRQYISTEVESFSALLDGFYETRDRQDRHRQQAGALLKTAKNLRDRVARKLEAQRLEQQDAVQRDGLREQGDLITANLHIMQKGQTALTTQNFYDPVCGEITISLDALKTPQQNAAAYYKRYTKAKAAEMHLAEQIAKGEQELDYLNSVLEAIERAETAGDVAQIRGELAEVGLLRPIGGGKKQKPLPSKPLEFVSGTGIRIYAGKNNLQNDTLTFKSANRYDTWLHAQKIHGSHVIIATGGAEPDAQTLEEAATIAAWYSQGRAGGRVPVDYTLVKHVKKPSGGKPGAAHYVNYKTIFVNSDEALVKRLQR